MREATFADYEGIRALQIRNGLATRPREDWAAFWCGNPAYLSRAERWPIGWVLETEDGEIAGSISNVPFQYQFGGRELAAAAACSWAVDAAYRGYSMQMLDRLTRQPGADFLVSTTVSAASQPAFRAFQWSRIPTGAWQEAAFWITNYPGFLRSALSVKHVPVARPLSYVFSPLLFCRDRILSPGLHSKGAAEIERCPGFDLRFDEFWEELKHQRPNALLAVRNRETLEWHFRHSISRQCAWILAARQGSRMVAYAVFDRCDNTWGLKRVRLVDFQALRGYEGLLDGFIRFMLLECRNGGIDILEYTGGWAEQFHTTAPYHRALPSWMFYYNTSSAELRGLLKDAAVWFPSSFDGDASI